MPDNTAGNFIDDLTNGDKAILGGSLVVLIAMFLPWYSESYLSLSDSVDGFHRWGLLSFVAWLLVLGLWLLRGPLSEQMKLPHWGVSDGMLFMILGGLEVLGAILFWVDGNSSLGGLNSFGVSAGPSFGLFVAIVGGALTIAGGYLKQSEPPKVTSGGPSTAPGGYGTPPAAAAPPPPPPSYGTPPPPAAPPAAPPSAPPSGGGAPPPPPPA
ncbi:MAG TPA: hypothetical protein VFC09_08090 [Candidatus Dormibacteraeota bacterium]|nr:hypothetical protein [Candidatus Dormibacteraeota bacterium]